MDDPQAVIWDLLYGRWRSQALYAGVKLGVFDALEDDAKSADAIAADLELDGALTYRLLRALGSIQVLVEHPGRTFTLSPAGVFLQSRHPESLKDVVLLREGPEHYALWKHLPAIVRDGKQDGFEREFGCAPFDYAQRTPSYAAAFDAAMSSYSRMQTGWALQALEKRNLGSISHLCDIGGGHGHLVGHFLVSHEDASGTVLDRAGAFDQSSALWAERLGVTDRCRFLAGDMFRDVPPADAYVLKMVLHNWNDQQCVQILTVARARASPQARIFIIEHVVPDIDTPHLSKLFDLHMMCWGTGRERTADEYAALLAAAGWTYMGNWPAPGGPISAIEGQNASQ